jgi:hypothetical protein
MQGIMHVFFRDSWIGVTDMANSSDLLGAMLRRGMTDSSKRRIEHSLSEKGIGGTGGILEQEFGVTPAREPVAAASKQESAASNPLGNLVNIAKSMLGEGQQGKTLALGGLGALAGALLGGGGKALRGALGGGALTLLGSIALQAMRGASQKKAPQLDSSARLAAGLRQPENADEEQEVQRKGVLAQAGRRPQFGPQSDLADSRHAKRGLAREAEAQWSAQDGLNGACDDDVPPASAQSP